MTAVAIIGAGGFVGTRIIESFVLHERDGIRAVVRNYKNMAGLCQFGSAIDVARADAQSVDALTAALRGCDTVVNVVTGPPAGIVRSTPAIHEACVHAGVRRFVHMSSAVVYGDVPQPIADDAAPLEKHWMPYARAKGAAENWLRERMGRGGPEIIVLRPGIVWGVRSHHTLDIAESLARKRAFVVGDGSGVFNGIYIDNLVARIIAAIDHPARVDGFYNVGDRETVTWLDFYGALGRPLGCDPARLPHISRDRFPASIASRIDTIQSLPGINELYHKLKVHLPDGLKAAIKAKLEGGYDFDRAPTQYAREVGVARELWQLQRVGHKLPIEKFVRTFGCAPPVSFSDGVAKTLAWLGSMGWMEPAQEQAALEVSYGIG